MVVFGEQAYYNRKAPCVNGDGKTVVVAICIQYNKANRFDPRWHALDTKFAHSSFLELVSLCGVEQEDIQVVTDETDQYPMATRENVLQALCNACNSMENDDYLVIYYTGHGAQLPSEDDDGVEEDGQDECWCTVKEDGSCPPSAWTRDNDVADAIGDNLPPKARFLMLSDSCHSGSMCDFENEDRWSTRRNMASCLETQHFHACSISGCEDSQESQGTGKGGVFSNSCFLAAERLYSQGKHDYSIGEMYNTLLEIQQGRKDLETKQNIHMVFPAHTHARNMPWPLAPLEGTEYKAPFNRKNY
jgi:hypothetical protein